MSNYNEFIPFWNSMSPVQKFKALVAYRKEEERKRKKSEYDKIRRAKKKAAKPTFIPPEGYLRIEDILRRHATSISSLKRFIAAKRVRIVKDSRFVWVCESDVIKEVERMDLERRRRK